jgi:hypothetical protein
MREETLPPACENCKYNGEPDGIRRRLNIKAALEYLGIRVNFADNIRDDQGGVDIGPLTKQPVGTYKNCNPMAIPDILDITQYRTRDLERAMNVSPCTPTSHPSYPSQVSSG